MCVDLTHEPSSHLSAMTLFVVRPALMVVLVYFVSSQTDRCGHADVFEAEATRVSVALPLEGL